MCGIIGEYSINGIKTDYFICRRDSLKHRGPDASGLYVSEDKKVALGHRRLSILDLSEKGNQPMEIGDFVISFNGEVYNFLELKKQLPGQYFSTTDTEVILRGYIKYGAEIFNKLDGMFALAIYDKKNNKFILARDRMGVKPLYYFQHSNNFQFASELQAVDAPKKLNLRSVQKFLYQNYIYGNETILDSVFKLPPGSYAEYNIDQESFTIRHYWQPQYRRLNIGMEEAVHNLTDVLRDSVKQSLISDVPLGVFLSSGIDSSLIAAISREFQEVVNTYNIGFENDSYDESKNAAEIARLLGTNHHAIKLNQKTAIEIVPKVIDSFDEPTGNSSAISTYLVSEFARKEIKVALSGDGADELFGGYPIYYLPFFNNIYRKMPGKKFIESIVKALPTSMAKMSFDYKLKRFVIAAKYPYQKAHFYYRKMHNEGVLNENFKNKIQDNFDKYFSEVKNEDTLTQLLHVDQRTILVDDYFVRVDRASMASSLEVRVPFLNNPVVELSHSLPSQYKVNGVATKCLLKKILENYLPKSYIYKTKMGFNNPIGSWLKKELKDFMVDTLSKENIDKIGIFNYNTIEVMKRQHISGGRDYNREIWGLINLVQYINKHNINV